MKDPNKVPGKRTTEVLDSELEDYERDKSNADVSEDGLKESSADAGDVLYDVVNGDYIDIERD